MVIDNAWETPVGSSLVNWAATMLVISSCPGSAVIRTTRSISLSESERFEPIHLGGFDLVTDSSLDWGIAEQVYDALLQAAPEEQPSDC